MYRQRRSRRRVVVLEAVAADENSRRGGGREAVAERLVELERSVADKKEFDRLAKTFARRSQTARPGARHAPGKSGRGRLSHLVLRDLWVIACGVPQAIWNQDRRRRTQRRRGARPECYARLLELALAARKDLYLNVDRRLALAGDVLSFPGGRTLA